MNDFLVSTPIKNDHCPKCQGNIYKALVDGFEVKVEPKRLNLLEEATLRLSEPKARIFQTFGIVNPELQRRTAWHIAKDDPRVKVFIEHRCDRLIARAFEEFFPNQVTTEMEF